MHGGDIRRSGDSVKTIALGQFTAHPSAVKLEDKCGVPADFLDAPDRPGWHRCLY